MASLALAWETVSLWELLYQAEAHSMYLYVVILYCDFLII